MKIEIRVQNYYTFRKKFKMMSPSRDTSMFEDRYLRKIDNNSFENSEKRQICISIQNCL